MAPSRQIHRQISPSLGRPRGGWRTYWAWIQQLPRPPTKAAIADMAGLDKSTLIPVLDRLEADQLLQRHPDPADRRVRLVSLTPKGHRALERSEATVMATEAELLVDLTAQEQAQFRGMLQRIVEGRMSTRSMPGSCL